MTTIKQMCDTIVKADMLRKSDDTPPTAYEIYNYSPTGELFQVGIWYEEALHILGEHDPEWISLPEK